MNTASSVRLEQTPAPVLAPDLLCLALNPRAVAGALARRADGLLPADASLVDVEVERVHARGEQGYLVHYRVMVERRGRMGDR